MSKPIYTKRVEAWETRNGTVIKVTVRDQNGRLHGATNFRDPNRKNLRVR